MNNSWLLRILVNILSDCSFSFNPDETGLFIDGKEGYSVSDLFGFLSVGGAGRILGEKRRSVCFTK